MTQSDVLEQLLHFTELTSANDSFYQVKQQVAEWFHRNFEVESVTIHILARAEQRSLELAAWSGNSAVFGEEAARPGLMLLQSLPGYLQETFVRGQSLDISDVQHSSLVDSASHLAAAGGALRTFPLIARASVVGVLCFFSSQPIQLSDEASRVVEVASMLIANLVDRDRMALEEEELYEQIEQLRRMDSQTGVYNRRYFNTVVSVEVSRAQRYRRPLSCLMFEIDQFQKISDTYGESFVELVLTGFASLLKTACRESDLLCHYTPGRFALLAVETNDAGACILGARLLELFAARSFTHGSQSVQLTASAGVASMPQPAIQSMEQLLGAADQAIQAALQNGGNTLVACDA